MKRFSVNAKEILVEMKDISESMLDLAYSAVLYSNREVAKEVLKLEERVDSLLYNARIAIMLGARNVEDAIKSAGILQIASAAEKVSNAAGDIAKTAMSIDIARYIDLEDFEEALINVKVKPRSVLKGKLLKALKLETKPGMRIFAIKRGSNWIYHPRKRERLQEGDLIIAVGPPEGIPVVYKMATGEEYKNKPRETTRRRITELIADRIAEMKNLSELMVGLAYSAVMFYSKDIAGEVKNLEERMDGMKDELEMLVLEAARDRIDKIYQQQLRGLLHVAISSEIIADAAYEIADVVLRDIQLHPVFLASIKEADEIISRIEVKNDDVSEKTLEELQIKTTTGMFILAIIKPDGRSIYHPADNVPMKKGDWLIARGPKEGEEKLKQICGYGSGFT
jgi:uncharacterized protein with PhoU and TrkA domain